MTDLSPDDELDARSVERAVGGDQRAFGDLVRRHQATALRVAFRGLWLDVGSGGCGAGGVREGACSALVGAAELRGPAMADARRREHGAQPRTVVGPTTARVAAGRGAAAHARGDAGGGDA